MYLDLRSEHDSTGSAAAARDLYRLAITFVVPRPIALVSSISADGRRNLAPFSFYNWVSANPPVLIVCPALKRDGSPKDTLVNILETKEFVVATVAEDMAERMNRCSAAYPRGVDEFAESGLTPKPANRVRAALVGEAAVNLECRLRQHISFGMHGGAGQAILGDVLAIHVDDAVLAADGLVDEQKLRAIGRLGRQGYARTRDAFDLPPPR
ncbi:MAG: flavin reductase family protein [Phycisphaerales bacterium]|nr:flavin reductase family protein [Phycisphaerales bacterium]